MRSSRGSCISRRCEVVVFTAAQRIMRLFAFHQRACAVCERSSTRHTPTPTDTQQQRLRPPGCKVCAHGAQAGYDNGRPTASYGVGGGGGAIGFTPDGGA